ncbi:MAG: GNAT family N-acetyltransferase [Candidatus Methylomirabilales bacterium]
MERLLESSHPAPVRLRLLAEAPGADWAGAAAAGHLALAPEWHGVIRRAYRHAPLYLTAEGEAGRAVLPAFILRRPLLGTAVTSMPFLDAGGPAGAAALAEPLLARLTLEAERAGARYVEVRATAPLPLPATPSLGKVSLALDLPGDPDRLWRGLHAKVRNQVRKAERSGLEVEAGGAPLLPAFYEVFAANMRDLGSPVHGQPFLQAALEAFGPRARLLLARRAGRPVGGLLALAHGDTLYVPWASSLRAEAAHCPNMLLYWEALRQACRDGLRRFDFGRSTRDSGTYRFKRQWGAGEVPLYWYALPLGGRAAPAPGGDERLALAGRLWRRLPLGLTRRLGPRLRRLLSQ